MALQHHTRHVLARAAAAGKEDTIPKCVFCCIVTEYLYNHAYGYNVTWNFPPFTKRTHQRLLKKSSLCHPKTAQSTTLLIPLPRSIRHVCIFSTCKICQYPFLHSWKEDSFVTQRIRVGIFKAFISYNFYDEWTYFWLGGLVLYTSHVANTIKSSSLPCQCRSQRRNLGWLQNGPYIDNHQTMM